MTDMREKLKAELSGALRTYAHKGHVPITPAVADVDGLVSALADAALAAMGEYRDALGEAEEIFAGDIQSTAMRSDDWESLCQSRIEWCNRNAHLLPEKKDE